MDHKSFGNLLFDAVRETLETMAFAEVVPCTFQIGDEEFTYSPQDTSENDFATPIDQSTTQIDFQSSEQSDAEDAWGVTKSTEPINLEDDDDDWATPDSNDSGDDAWGTPAANDSADDASWGEMPAESAPEDDAWGENTANASDNENDDPWGDGAPLPGSGFTMQASDINFNTLIENEEDWVWSCMRVNSPDIHSVWFVVSKSLAMELARNMYAGENLELESPIIRDLVAELTNVLGGRLMLLLEKMGGQFTLAVPDIGVGLPKMPDTTTMETVLCKVLVDGEYPVMSSICFNKKD